MDDTRILEEQLSYYRARAPEYDEGFLRTGRYDRGPEHRAEWFSEVARIEAVLEPLVRGKDVLELACGTGRWTKHLARWSAKTLAVDAAPEALLISMNELRASNVEYAQADVFSLRPDRAFDVVFFSFWLSHIPAHRFDAFWRAVRLSLRPHGCVFFIDNILEPASTARDHAQLDKSGVAKRKLNDGRQFQIVKIFYEPSVLEKRLRDEGWSGWVRSSGKFFLYGCLTPSSLTEKDL